MLNNAIIFTRSCEQTDIDRLAIVGKCQINLVKVGLVVKARKEITGTA